MRMPYPIKYTDLFIDFDDTLYDTYGNAVVALRETFEEFHLERYFSDPQVFYNAYWAANIDLWTRYSKGEITRDYLIVERFRRPLSRSARFPACDIPTLGSDGSNADIPTLGSVGSYVNNPTQESVDSYVEKLCLNINDRFLDYCSSKPGVIDGAHELMDYLKGKGYRMHMCSNGFHEVQYKKLDACGLRNHFDTIILSEDAGANKPSKAFFDYAFQRSGASPATTIMIGDNLRTDIVGAKEAGLDTILFNRWDVDPADIPTFTVSSLLQIKDIL